MQGLARLKTSARQQDPAAAAEAARQFEAMFINMMMKSMRDAVPSSGLTDSKQTQFYQTLLDQQWSQTMASRGIGLADQLMAQLRGPEASQAKDVEALIAGIPRGTPRPLSNALRADAPTDSEVEAPTNFLDELGAVSQGMTTAQAEERISGREARDTPAHVQAFLDKLAAPAQAASRASGVPAELILAQAALETGWGRHEIATADGNNSHNLFGIKAGSSWDGPTTRITTHEVEDGQRQRIRDDFRVYGSFEEAFTDYARLISNNARYAEVTTAPDAEAAAHALQRGGYATDPAYAAKLIAVMHTFGPIDDGAGATRVAAGEARPASVSASPAGATEKVEASYTADQRGSDWLARAQIDSNPTRVF
ncbi:flagellar assembly peptidoglycan hydrolase FlgJ [Halomonas sp. DN3]|uniref:flagellar assembly peptidoglycan hydrolase FlgJ n=1 Tax=Halomonas sp. DN3 TaxID=2953657 RepID=UPI00209E9C14|nr:flagellar assembly peptidoglycan hydrolase FlgJ [Halomonas sp. DN3]USZ52063.1 flagellar assembly peptidoglycan hydrolase FlgJ [Halomonas sp. DN3]